MPYLLDAGGVQLVDQPLRIDFGRTEASTVPAMSELVGAQPVDMGVCSQNQRFSEWRDGPSTVTLYFDGAAFVASAQTPQGDTTPACARDRQG